MGMETVGQSIAQCDAVVRQASGVDDQAVDRPRKLVKIVDYRSLAVALEELHLSAGLLGGCPNPCLDVSEGSRPVDARAPSFPGYRCLVRSQPRFSFVLLATYQGAQHPLDSLYRHVSPHHHEPDALRQHPGELPLTRLLVVPHGREQLVHRESRAGHRQFEPRQQLSLGRHSDPIVYHS